MAAASERLAELGIVLPEAPAPAAAYQPYIVHDGIVWTAGQIARAEGELVAQGVVGRDVDLDAARACARQCAINVLAQLAAAAGGDLDRVARVLRLTVYVASTADFTDQHLVANAASDLVGEVLGEAGLHARSAVGVAVLPLGSPVEVEAVAALA